LSVPNEVFLRTRAGLSAMVSARAAGRILEGALKGSGQSPEDVDLRQMQSALLGPVLQELEGVLPRHGLKRNLERLARSLRAAERSPSAESDVEEAGDEAEPLAMATGSIPIGIGVDTRERPRSTPFEPTSAGSRQNLDDETFRAGGPADFSPDRPATHDEDTETTSGAQSGAVEPEPGSRTPVVRRTLDQDGLERAITRFAQIENVRLVASIRKDGTVATSRGEGPDLAMLARLSRLALTLLAKGGPLRSLHVGHTDGQLFLFPTGPDLLVVFGNVDLNLGAVTNAFTALALEEEL
jgi:predicted regulator of Ras-like GTPase activity (Roadblock/LC7/MglB family)